MGFLKNIFTSVFGGGQTKAGGIKPPRRPPSRSPASSPFGRRQPQMPVDEHLAKALLDEIGGDEDDIRRGKIMQVQSSNVAWFRWLPGEDAMEISYLDGSVYRYEDIPLEMAFDMYRSGSKGGFVWDRLRVRGTVFGYQKSYSFLDGPSKATRVWHEAGLESRRRHGAIPPSGEPFRGFHPAFAHQVGGMGKRRGSGAKKASRKKKGPF